MQKGLTGTQHQPSKYIAA